jgi:ribosomal protein S12 methylthiotransferase
VFPYSPEPGTEAAPWAASSTRAVAAERASELASVQEAVSFGARSRFHDSVVRVLVDRDVDASEAAYAGCGRAGRFYGQALEIDGEVYVEGAARVGEFVDVRITETDVFDLRGRVVSAGR